ncbi:MAG TPA: alpha/beta hydrolase [Arachidicoccus sp.]
MDKSFSHNNYSISYQKLGVLKPAVVLIHGFPEEGAIFKFQCEFLKEKFTVIVPDLPGSGKSAYNPNLQSIEDYAEIIELILQEEQIEECFMLGHSMGGYISLAYAEKYSKRLLGLGLIHSTAYADNDEKKENRKRSMELMEKYGGFQFLKTTVPNLFSEDFLVKQGEVIDELIEKGKLFETKTLQQYYFIMMNRKDRSDILKKIDVPVLFIIGEKDKAVLMKDILQQTSLPKVSFIKILPNAAHMGFLEETKIVNQSISAFLS